MFWYSGEHNSCKLRANEVKSNMAIRRATWLGIRLLSMLLSACETMTIRHAAIESQEMRVTLTRDCEPQLTLTTLSTNRSIALRTS
jgi:hypothetical protein